MSRLQAGRPIKLRLGAGANVTVHAGRVWLTETGSLADQVIGAGESTTIASRGDVVMECCGLEVAVVVVQRNVPARSAFDRLASTLFSASLGAAWRAAKIACSRFGASPR
ncbi:MAG: DUF2917 domain-containing protein [Proteobacteria bacterium]|nr:DUF2917 domain-containing protein [Burkholderiales bacterium]